MRVYVIPLCAVLYTCVLHTNFMEGGTGMYSIQKASILKRISAFLLDFILMTIAVTGFAFAISAITGYDSYVAKIEERRVFIASEYDVDLEISAEEREALTEEDKARYDAAEKALEKDPEALRAYDMLINLTLVMISLSLLLSFIALELVIPIILKNGQTVGKKVFSIGVVHVNSVRLTGIGLFTRAMLGKYTVETMIPVIMILMLLLGNGFTSLLVLGLLIILEMFVFFKNKMGTPIHDVLAHTVCVDLSIQMIYENEDELIKHKKQLHAEMVEDADYK